MKTKREKFANQDNENESNRTLDGELKTSLEMRRMFTIRYHQLEEDTSQIEKNNIRNIRRSSRSLLMLYQIFIKLLIKYNSLL